MSFPPIPPEVKSIAHFLKVAAEHDDRNVVVSYWARMFAVQRAMSICPGKKPPEVSKLLMALMEWMEETKKNHKDNEGIVNEMSAQALIEEYALQLFTYGDSQDRASNFNKNTIKAFYTAGILMDILEQFGTLSDDIQGKRKYAKWKAAYIHNCLKIGDIPIPGAPDEHLDNVVHRSDLINADDPPKTDDDFNAPSTSPKDPTPPPPVDSSPFGFFNQPVAPPAAPVVPPVAPVVTPQTPTTPTLPAPAQSGSNGTLSPGQIQKAQKFCKYATSALNYDDINTAIDNLKKALNMLQLGREE